MCVCVFMETLSEVLLCARVCVFVRGPEGTWLDLPVCVSQAGAAEPCLGSCAVDFHSGKLWPLGWSPSSLAVSRWGRLIGSPHLEESCLHACQPRAVC